MNAKKIARVGLLTMSAMTLAYGEDWAIQGNIPFQFAAGKSAMPSGDYEFIPDPREPLVRIQPDHGPAIALPVITRLAAGIHSTATDAHVVFDKVGFSYVLSEIWLPGEDGYLLHATKVQHEHQVVHLPHHK